MHLERTVSRLVLTVFNQSCVNVSHAWHWPYMYSLSYSVEYNPKYIFLISVQRVILQDPAVTPECCWPTFVVVTALWRRSLCLTKKDNMNFLTKPRVQNPPNIFLTTAHQNFPRWPCFNHWATSLPGLTDSDGRAKATMCTGSYVRHTHCYISDSWYVF